ncbi:LysM peptidoglycan-binding domain-containing protein [Kutzneria chonburiensis]|uniref:LysM peptidoglycan-binding domain-containing protein n=1 Tax=Kutzneria chonburiensis TaxID=1483604 RepID=A0ABV6N3B2_9PSEU|nr:LysM peptidoglycan-binding domain-containing protein [Kutzneria chonburiensis]
MQHGIDISGWNSVNDWNAVRGDGIEFASIKVTQGDYYTNPQRASQADNARRAGVVAGGYHFADPQVSVAANVATFVRELNFLGLSGSGSFAPMLDIENSPSEGINWNPDNSNAFVSQFIQEFRRQAGVRQIAVYANLSFWNSILRPNEWADDGVFVWLALYNGDPGNTGGYQHPRLAVHQHTSGGYVPGISGNVDKNVTLGAFSLDSLRIDGSAPTSPPSGPPAPPQDSDTYTVQAGDTLSGIAARFGVSWQELAQINGLADPNIIHPGQVLRIHGGGGQPAGGSGYTVQAGDTLSGIGAKLGVDWPAIASLNGLGSPYTIYPGQVLQIPAGGGAPAPAPRTYTVQAGDSLSVIGERLGVDWRGIASANGISSPFVIYPGQVLRY